MRRFENVLKSISIKKRPLDIHFNREIIIKKKIIIETFEN